MHSKAAAIAVNRFGLGARPGDADLIGSDPRGWLSAQLTADRRTDRTAQRPASAETFEQITELRLARQAARRALARLEGSDNESEPSDIDRAAIREYGQFIARTYRSQAETRLRMAINAERAFAERLTQFWSNHFAISADKQPIGAVAYDFVQEAIRPHLTGNFLELLTASEQHPAMLFYLDNQLSIGSNSTVARTVRRRRNRQLGLNENLAREILELHTLGVDGGYGQEDVTEFAKVLTGWSIGGRIGRFDSGSPGEFEFRTMMHEPGYKRVLGQRIAEGGVDEGLDVLAMLATHPSTARHIATKLARHFVADQPPPELVDQLTRVYLDTNGELEPVYSALIEHPAAWREPLAKFKTPEEFVVSTFRGLDLVPPNLGRQIGMLTQLGQRPLTPRSPAGWPDTAADWDGGDALLKRIEWASAIGRNVGDRIDPGQLAARLLGPVASDTTISAVRRAESAGQGLTLLLSAPEFQRR
jgi:uncharacterized protein (DUF1800 family)